VRRKKGRGEKRNEKKKEREKRKKYKIEKCPNLKFLRISKRK
jgi:hypothetical protein